MIGKLQKNELGCLFFKQEMGDVLNLLLSIAYVDADHDPMK